jgi:hypothetical protein
MGLFQLILIAVVVLLFLLGARQLSRVGAEMRQRMSGASEILGNVAGAVALPVNTDPVADDAYSSMPRAGALAELFGIGPEGIRWGQVIVVTIGTWASFNINLLMNPSRNSVSGAEDLAFMILMPAFFVFAAITAIRSSQSQLAVALLAGLLYSVSTIALRYGLSPESLSFMGDGWWIRAGASRVIWTFLAITALQYAVVGRQMWLRMIVFLTVASFVSGFISQALYAQDWDPLMGIESLIERVPEELPSDLVWVLGFWLGQLRSNRR